MENNKITESFQAVKKDITEIRFAIEALYQEIAELRTVCTKPEKALAKKKPVKKKSRR